MSALVQRSIFRTQIHEKSHVFWDIDFGSFLEGFWKGLGSKILNFRVFFDYFLVQWDWKRPGGVKRCENEAQKACDAIWTANNSPAPGHGEVSPLPAGWTPPSREPCEAPGVAAHTKHWIFADFKIGLENQILRPRVAKRVPKPSPNLSKWSPRLIKIQFLKHFWSDFFACKICIDLVFVFRGILHFLNARPL